MGDQVMAHGLGEEDSLRLLNSLRQFLRWSRVKDVEDIAHESFARLLRSLQAGHRIENDEAYIRQIARNVMKEDSRRRRQAASLTENPLFARPQASPNHAENLSRCLEWCKKHCLSAAEVEFLETYYGSSGKERKKLADDLGASLNTLRLKAFRLRRKLFECIKECEAAGEARNDSADWSLSSERNRRG